MTSRGYYRWSLALPVVTPVAVIAAFYAVVGITGTQPSNETVFGVVMVLGGSVVLGGIPYALCAIFLARGLSRWTMARFKVVSYVVPIGFALVMALLGVFVAGQMALLLGVCSLVFGYVYVILAHTGYALLQVLGRIQDPVPMPVMRTIARSPSRGTSG